MNVPLVNRYIAFILTCALVSPTLPALASVPDETTTITLDQAVHFIGTDGSDVLAAPGDYSVEAAQEWLRLIPGTERRDALLIEAQPGTHDVKVEIPIVISTPGTEPEEADVHVVQYLHPDGTSMMATGTYSGIQSRGLRDAARAAAARAQAAAEAARRAAAAKAQQVKDAARLAALRAKQAAEEVARKAAEKVHDRLFDAPPPFNAGHNAFKAAFNENAVGYAPANAYLLTYLAALIYPEFLDQLSGDPLKQDKNYVERMHKKPQAFVQEYANRTHHLFWNAAAPPEPANQRPQYVWVWGHLGGLDPEAMVISTAKAVFVVFRGTDRVAQAKGQGYNWAEWIQTDFVALGISPRLGSLPGLVHAGFWASLIAPSNLYVPAKAQVPGKIGNGLPFRDAVLNVIKAFGGGQKKVWVIGHSLGAAHVQLYGAYLTANGLPPQGVYAIAAPHVGDQTFVNQLNAMFPNNRLQRFDFVHDPVTKVPPRAPLPQAPGTPPITYARAGTRVYYNDVETVQFGASERPPAEAARMAALLTAPIPLTRLFASGDFCYHYPHWHLKAAYNRLDQATVARVPSPLLTPVMRGDVYTWLCGPIQVTRGNRSSETVKKIIGIGK